MIFPPKEMFPLSEPFFDSETENRCIISFVRMNSERGKRDFTLALRQEKQISASCRALLVQQLRQSRCRASTSEGREMHTCCTQTDTNARARARARSFVVLTCDTLLPVCTHARTHARPSMPFVKQERRKTWHEAT